VWKASAYGDFDKLKAFADVNPSLLNQPDDQGYYVIQWAALNGRVPIIAYLIDRGCDINATDTTGQTALHWAAVRGSIAAAETLLRGGADLEAADSRGYTVVHVAAQYGQTAAIYHLAMKWGVEIDSVDSDGRAPLHWAAYKGFGDLVKLLLVMGARPALPDAEGCTPLHWAAMRGNSEPCTALLQGGGAEALDCKDATGSTPAQLALEKGHRLMAVHLAEHRRKEEKQRRGPKGLLGMMGSLHLAPIVWAIILGMLTFMHYGVVRNPNLAPPSSAALLMSWVVFALAGGGLYYLYLTTTLDPGFLARNTAGGHDIAPRWRRGAEAPPASAGPRDASPRLAGSLDSPALWAGSWSQICVTCRIVRPLRAKHCSVTGRCVECYDHYCPWVGNCIGKGNRAVFLTFLWLEVGAVLVAALLGVARIHTAIAVPRQSADSHQGQGTLILAPVLFCVFDSFLLLSVAALALAQASQVSHNVTTNELANWQRYRYLQSADGEYHNPFDKGWKANCGEVCGPERAQQAPYTLPEHAGGSAAEEGDERTGLLKGESAV
jgi:palmitoyltransferase ZDHHC13/17